MAISNHRLVSFVDGQVAFRWRDSAHHNEQKLTTLSQDKFLRRFLLHILPQGFVRIRHFGFLACRRRRTTLPLCSSCWVRHKKRLARQVSSTEDTPDLYRCPKCGGPMKVIEGLTAAEIQLVSTTDQLCGMKLLSPTPTLRALLRATPLSASSENKFLHAISSTIVFTTPFHPSHFLGSRFNGSCSAAPFPRTSKPSLPTIEFA